MEPKFKIGDMVQVDIMDNPEPFIISGIRQCDRSNCKIFNTKDCDSYYYYEAGEDILGNGWCQYYLKQIFKIRQGVVGTRSFL